MVQLVVRDVEFSYGRHQILRRLSASWSGGVVGLLGLNGAGKTTLLRILATTSAPDRGSIELNGAKTQGRKGQLRLRRTLGYLPQDASWSGAFTVQEFGHYFAWLHGVPSRERAGRVDEAAELAGVSDLRGRKLGELSGGQHRRAMLIQALVHRPSLLLLDEPTAGLDPEQRVRMREMVRYMAAERLVVLSTHQVDDVGYLGGRVAILHDGRFVFDGSAVELSSRARFDDPGDNPMEQGFHRVIATHRDGS